MVHPHDALYQSILMQLSLVAIDQLAEVDAYLRQLTEANAQPSDNRAATMSFAGSWNDMSDEDFAEYLKAARDPGIVEP